MKCIIVCVLLFLAQALSAQSPVPRWVRTGHVGGVNNLLFTPDGKHFISSATEDNRILVWNTTTGDYERTIPIPYRADFFPMSFSPDGSIIAYGADTGIYLIDFSTGDVTDTIFPSTSEPISIQFSRSGDTIAWVSDNYYMGLIYCRFDRIKHSLIDTLYLGGYIEFYDLNLSPSNTEHYFSISSDTKKIAYFYSEDTVAVVDINQKFATNLFYTHFAYSVALNSNGSQLAVGTVGGFSSNIFNVVTGQTEFTWPDTASPGVPQYLGLSDTIFYFSDTGFWLHVPGNPNDEYFKTTRTTTGSSGLASDFRMVIMTFSSDRRQFIAANDQFSLAGFPTSGTISIYQKPDFIESEVTDDFGSISGLEWSPVTDTITLSGDAIRSYDADTGILVYGIGPDDTRIGGLAYFVNSNDFAYSFFNNDDDECGECDGVSMGITLMSFGAQYYPGLLVSPNRKQVVIGNVFDTTFGSIWLPNLPPLAYSNAFAFPPDGAVLLIGDSTHLVTMATSNTKILTTLSDPDRSHIVSASFSPDGSMLSVVHADSSVEILSYPACVRLQELRGHTAPVTNAKFSADGKYLISSSLDSTMIVWDVATGKNLFVYTYPSLLYTVGFSHDGRYVAASDGKNTIIVWDAPSFMKVESGVQDVAISLSQNMPNPVSSETTVSYSIPYSEEVTIDLFDIMGHEVARLPQGVMSAGSHTVQFDAPIIHSLARGVYYYRLDAPSGAMTKRMIVE